MKMLFFLIISVVVILVSLSFMKNKNGLRIGDKIPKFILPQQNGSLFNIDSLIGKKNLVVFFYPKDFTMVCTKEACSFRDNYEKFKEVNAEVIGISGQDVNSKKDFAAKYNLQFFLLSDEENKVRKLFGVPSSVVGMPGRVTYVVDKNGIIRDIFNSSFESDEHVNNALDILKNLK